MSTQNNSTEKRSKFKIEVEEHIALPAIAKTAYVSSNEFCRMVSELFKGVFADWEGCIFNVPNGGDATISLLFNHGQYEEDALVACHRNNAASSGSSIIDRTRTRDRQMTEGDRYYLTENGEDVFRTLLTNRAYNSGNPNWKSLVGEYIDRNSSNYYNIGQLPQYTCVSNISLSRMCGLLFGDTIDGEPVEYDVRITSPIAAPNTYGASNVVGNYMLTITVVSSNVVRNVYEKLGFGTVGATIIR